MCFLRLTLPKLSGEGTLFHLTSGTPSGGRTTFIMSFINLKPDIYIYIKFSTLKLSVGHCVRVSNDHVQGVPKLLPDPLQYLQSTDRVRII